MTPRFSGHFSIFGLVFFVLKSLLRIARQWRSEKFGILSLKLSLGVMLEFEYIERGLFLYFLFKLLRSFAIFIK